MPRFSDDWVVSKSLFEYTTGGSCVCCTFPTIFDPDGLKGLINSISDFETDAANAAINSADNSPFPPEMRDSIWGDRVKVRFKMKKEMKGYQEFLDSLNEEQENKNELDVLMKFCKDVGVKKLKQVFQMPRSEVTDILSNKYTICGAFGTIMCAIVEQVANFKLTKYPHDGRGLEEIAFEKVLQYDRFGGFVLDVGNNDEDMNEDVILTFLKMMKSLAGPKLLQRGPSTSKKNDDDDDEDDEGGADDALATSSTGKDGPCFRSDRRIARLIIARYWADNLMNLYKKQHASD